MNSFYKFFYFNKTERRALFVFLLLIVIVKLIEIYLLPKTHIAEYDFKKVEQWWSEDPQPYLISSNVKNKTSKPITSHKTISNAEKLMLNINTTDSLDLMSIPGIGEVYASRIIKYRDLLGGYYYKDQLYEVYGMDSSLVLSIQQYVWIDKSEIHRINVNKSTMKQLYSHPYISYKLAKLIVKYREHHGFYTNIEDLKKIPLIDGQLFRKIVVYLVTE